MVTPIILGKDGLTQTSANHLANIAKEIYEALESKLEALRLVSRDFTLAVNGETYRVENESTPEELSVAAESLKEIASLKAFIAWLREGIKAKEKLSTQASEEEYLSGLIKSGRKNLELPEFGEGPTFESVLAEMPADYQAHYYALEAKCATFGKFIHPEGHFAQIRGNYFLRLKNPTNIAGRGQDAEINTYSTGFMPQDVDEAFFALQKKYRCAQAEFNSLKSEIDNKLGDQRREYLDRKKQLFEAWMIAREKEGISYQESVKALKIIIPESMKETFNKVNTVAAQK